MSHAMCEAVLMKMRLAREAMASRAGDDKPLVAGGEPQLCPEVWRRVGVSGHDPLQTVTPISLRFVIGEPFAGKGPGSILIR